MKNEKRKKEVNLKLPPFFILFEITPMNYEVLISFIPIAIGIHSSIFIIFF